MIVNLSEMDYADARRMIDFVSGLVFVVHGTLDRVTKRVFILAPPGVQVCAADERWAGSRRRLQPELAGATSASWREEDPGMTTDSRTRAWVRLSPFPRTTSGVSVVSLPPERMSA